MQEKQHAVSVHLSSRVEGRPRGHSWGPGLSGGLGADREPAASSKLSMVVRRRGNATAYRKPRPAWYSFASRPVVAAIPLVIGATRAPALCDGIHAVTKRGQMTGQRGESLDHKRLLLKERLRHRRLQDGATGDGSGTCDSRRRRGGFQKVSIRPLLPPQRLSTSAEKYRYAGNSREPSVALEPTTPSLPWKGESVTSVNRRSRTGTKSL